MRTGIGGASCVGLGVVLAAMLLAGCGEKAPGDGARAAATDPPHSLLISPEDLLTVRSDALASGPSITGSIQPERRADLRAEIPAVVLQVLKDNGDPVRRGDLLVRLDDTTIRDALASATASERAATLSYEQAQKQYERLAKLRETNLVSAQQVEDAEIRRNTTQSEREAARTQVVSARQQLQRTEVRAPFDGIVSDRRVSAGDTVQIGRELMKVIDPRSLRFEGLVSANDIGEVEAGQKVFFRIHGFTGREFTGTIARVNPAANSITRQVEVLAAFDDPGQRPEVAGLYAEGRVETRSTAALTIPASALVREGDSVFAWRLKDTALQKVSLKLGARDARTGGFAVDGGLAEGDAVLRYPTANLHDGQPVERVASAGSAGK